MTNGLAGEGGSRPTLLGTQYMQLNTYKLGVYHKAVREKTESRLRCP